MDSDALLFFSALIIPTAFGIFVAKPISRAISNSNRSKLRKSILSGSINALAFGPSIFGAGDGVLIMPCYLSIITQPIVEPGAVIVSILIFLFWSLIFSIFLYIKPIILRSL